MDDPCSTDEPFGQRKYYLCRVCRTHGWYLTRGGFFEQLVREHLGHPTSLYLFLGYVEYAGLLKKFGLAAQPFHYLEQHPHTFPFSKPSVVTDKGRTMALDFSVRSLAYAFAIPIVQDKQMLSDSKLSKQEVKLAANTAAELARIFVQKTSSFDDQTRVIVKRFVRPCYKLSAGDTTKTIDLAISLAGRMVSALNEATEPAPVADEDEDS